jgi:hypothetical protein
MERMFDEKAPSETVINRDRSGLVAGVVDVGEGARSEAAADPASCDGRGEAEVLLAPPVMDGVFSKTSKVMELK